MFLYIVYGLLSLFCIYTLVVLVKQKKIFALPIPIIFFVFSVINFFEYAEYNFLPGDTCLESEGCMNETGMLLVFAIFFMFIATFLSTLFVTFSKKKDIN